jgi:prenyltransferase beta subunit
MNAIYWGLMALCTMGKPDALDREELIAFVVSCWDEKVGTSEYISCWLFILICSTV